MSTSPYSARVSMQLAAERQKDEARRAQADASRVMRRKSFQLAAAWLENAVIAAVDRCVAECGGAVLIDCRNNFTSEAQDAYKNPHVVFSIQETGGMAGTQYEVFVAHGLVCVHRIRHHMRQPVTVPGFAGPQLVSAAPMDLGAAIVRLALEEHQRGA